VERAAVARGGVDDDGAVHGVDDALADGEAEAGAAEFASGGGVALGERLEEAFTLVVGDADA
jgi:hypothetical protein